MKGSYIPCKLIRILREYTRYRYKLVSCHSSEKNRYQNAITVCNVALDSVVSDIFGKSSSSYNTATRFIHSYCNYLSINKFKNYVTKHIFSSVVADRTPTFLLVQNLTWNYFSFISLQFNSQSLLNTPMD